MIIDFTRRQIMIAVVFVLFILGLFVGGYFLFIQPEKHALDQKQTDVQMLQQELTIVENKLKQIKERTIVSSMELQKQVPVKPLLEQLLLDIEKAELLSESTVLQIKVGSTAEEVAFPKKTTSTTNQKEEVDDGKTTNDDESKQTVEQFLPKGMKMLKVNIDGEATSYFHMEKFIDVLQTLQRVIRIDGVKFSGQEEITDIDDDFEKISFEVMLTAFYYPNLTDLIDELPKLDTPPPSEKRNPLNSFADHELETIEKRKIAKKEIEKAQQTNEQQTNEPDNIQSNTSSVPEERKQTPQPVPTVIEHEVQPGDTLYYISMKYYGSRAGEQKIKDVNGLTADTIQVGQILKIPR